MRRAYSRLLAGRWRTGLFAMLAALCLLCMTATATFADTVNIYDKAGVLDQTKVRNEASSLSYPIDIYTTSSFTGSTSSFDQTAKNSLKKSNLIVIAIDTAHRHLAIVGGSGVSLSNSQYTDARNAFANNFSNNDYTSATVAAVQSLRNASGNSSSGGVSVPGVGNSAGGGIGFGAICCIGFLVLAAIAVFAIVRGRKSGAGMGFFNRGFNRGPVTPPYDPNYNQYNQGGYPPNYGPGYNQNRGINPLAAGGLGAAAGGLLGYELGKEQGENENDRGNNNDGGGFGGGSSGDFGGGNNDGGGSSGDFGGGNNDGGGFGGGNDGGGFGGGSSGDFGGGGDSGSSGSF